MAFYVSYASAAGKCRIHRSSCPFCQDGAVDHDAHTTVSWSPMLQTMSGAEAYAMRMFPSFADRGNCDRCMLGDFVRGSYWPFNLRGWIGKLLSSKPKTRVLLTP